ncbi:hypothetical protein [Nannocystis pusilla]|uniref:hypothetical protein n=1 Tax=Nannocystis pusilla TaxID=889268 RepID=UPI003DA4536E
MRSPPPLLLLAFALAACPPPPDFVGETLPGRTTGDATAVPGPETGVSVTTVVQDPTTTTTGGSTTTSDETGTSAGTGAPASAYGSFCELVGAGPDLQQTVIVPQPACDGGICLLVSDAGPLACTLDAQCEEEAAGSVCADNGLCNLSPGFVEANARCTQLCETDQDCPAVPGCATGLRCTTITLIGPLCCQRVCACEDHLSGPQADDAEAICAGDPELCL